MSDRAPQTDVVPAPAPAPEVREADEVEPAQPAPSPGRLSGVRTSAPLAVGAADDPCEHEAEQTAVRVAAFLRDEAAGAPGAVALGGDGGAARAHRSLGGEGAIGASGGALDDGASDEVGRARGSGGQPLAPTTRSSMERAFGADFGAVRVHTGKDAATLNRSMSASAFTVGSDIFFRDGLPDSGTDAGRTLLAHELTHVVQQQGGAARTIRRTDGPASGTAAPAVAPVRVGEASVPRGPDAPDAGVEDTPPPRFHDDPDGEGDPFDRLVVHESLPERPIEALKGYQEDEPVKAAALLHSVAGSYLKKVQTLQRSTDADAQYLLTDEAVFLAKGAAAGREWTQQRALGTPDAIKRCQALESYFVGHELAERATCLPGSFDVGLVVEQKRRRGAAEQATAVLDSEVPLVDGVYQQTATLWADMKTVGKESGGRSVAHEVSRLAEMKKQGDAGGVAKHEARLARLRGKAGDVRRVRGLVDQSDLSHSLVVLQSGQLEGVVEKVKASTKTRDALLSLAGTVATAGVNSVLGLATLGMVTVEVDDKEGTGGHDKEVKLSTVLTRWKDLVEQLETTSASGAYGSSTEFYVGLEKASALITIVRDLAGGVAALATVLAAVSGPAAPFFVTVASLASLVAFGLLALKTLVDAVRASWSLVAKALNTNHRNAHLLTAQSKAGVVATVGNAATFAAPALSAQLGKVGDRVADRLGKNRAIEAPDGAAPSTAVSGTTDGWRAKGENLGQTYGEAGTLGAAQGAVAASKVTDNAETLAGMALGHDDDLQTAHTKDGDLAAARPAAQGWAVMAGAQREEAEARASSEDALVSKHMALLVRFEARTQKLMVGAAEKRAEAAKDKKAALSASKAGAAAGDDDTGPAGVAASVEASMKNLLAGSTGAREVLAGRQT